MTKRPGRNGDFFSSLLDAAVLALLSQRPNKSGYAFISGAKNRFDFFLAGILEVDASGYTDVSACLCLQGSGRTFHDLAFLVRWNIRSVPVGLTVGRAAHQRHGPDVMIAAAYMDIEVGAPTLPRDC